MVWPTASAAQQSELPDHVDFGRQLEITGAEGVGPQGEVAQRSRPDFLPLPLARPFQLPQQNAPGIVVAEARADGGFGENEPLLPLPGAPAVPGASATAVGSAKTLQLSHFAYGAYQRGLYETALTVALRASAQDDANAAALIGRLYEEALGVDQDLPKAAGWYALAADLGNAQAQNRLGAMLLAGRGVPENPEKAAELFEEAAANGNADAAHSLALMLLRGTGRERDPEAAFQHMAIAAEHGDAAAQVALAIMYEDGEGTTPDAEAATRWYGRAAATGDPVASRAYAERLLARDEDADAGVAVKFLQIAANAGDPQAMNLLARTLADGRGVEPNAAEAIKWHLLARRAGISDLYLDGYMGTRELADIDEGRARADAFAGG